MRYRRRTVSVRPGECDRYRIVFRAYSGAVFPESKKYGRIDDGENNLLAARLELIQAKYMAILNQQLLNFYQGIEISIQ